MGFIINPYQFGVPFTGLLDTYSGAAAAYSAARRLSSTYTGALIRVRRSSDNTEQNIGFDSNGNLDTTALTTFVGANNGFVTTWYDQSGNSKDATQTTAANQPQIVTSGVVNLKNGKPCVSFNGTSFRMQTSAISWGTSFTFTGVFNAIKTGGYSKLYQIGNDSATGGYAFATFVGLTEVDWSVDDSLAFGKGYNTSSYPRIISNGRILNDNTQYTTFISLNSSSSNFYKNNTEISYRIQQPGNSDSSSMILYLGSSEGTFGYQYFKGDLQEAIYYTSNQSSNRTGVNSNINTYYSIY